MKYTNRLNLPLSIAVWLSQDNYDYNYDPKVISATTLLKPVRQIILNSKITEQDVDVSALVASRMGSSIHDSIEKAWTEPHKALESLGMPFGMIGKVKVNPKPDDLLEDDISVYMELRGNRKLGEYSVSGKFDFCMDGVLEDFKSTSTRSYTSQSNADKYIMQGSIYRWIFPDIIKEDYMIIDYIFTDWSAIKAAQDKEYPQTRVLAQHYKLKSIPETEAFIRDKINQVVRYQQSNQDEIPLCSEEDLWTTETVYKYFKNPNASRSTKNFSNFYEAQQRFVQDGSIGLVKTVPGEVRACRYCAASSICNQAKQLKDEGRLVI